ncbi:hypothetical protein DASC09_043990 [Saccharomycopsis crataegensis]|uniref:Uncharacterized protein n=1 Tax=Saccharomycopsis crataegensis TaxID=43959 RepID=A0AAV5QQP8_9ASCO|nr:hypothetical protein DASC09_043990 [Saccharomycopsis crataegensis]
MVSPHDHDKRSAVLLTSRWFFAKSGKGSPIAKLAVTDLFDEQPYLSDFVGRLAFTHFGHIKVKPNLLELALDNWPEDKTYYMKAPQGMATEFGLPEYVRLNHVQQGPDLNLCPVQFGDSLENSLKSKYKCLIKSEDDETHTAPLVFTAIDNRGAVIDKSPLIRQYNDLLVPSNETKNVSKLLRKIFSIKVKEPKDFLQYELDYKDVNSFRVSQIGRLDKLFRSLKPHDLQYIKNNKVRTLLTENYQTLLHNSANSVPLATCSKDLPPDYVKKLRGKVMSIKEMQVLLQELQIIANKTRFDIQFAVYLLRRFFRNPTPLIHQQILQVLTYLWNTKHSYLDYYSHSKKHTKESTKITFYTHTVPIGKKGGYIIGYLILFNGKIIDSRTDITKSHEGRPIKHQWVADSLAITRTLQRIDMMYPQIDAMSFRIEHITGYSSNEGVVDEIYTQRCYRTPMFRHLSHYTLSGQPLVMEVIKEADNPARLLTSRVGAKTSERILTSKALSSGFKFSSSPVSSPSTGKGVIQQDFDKKFTSITETPRAKFLIKIRNLPSKTTEDIQTAIIPEFTMPLLPKADKGNIYKKTSNTLTRFSFYVKAGYYYR